jgi:mannose-6-phosphate isomerase-like protein (cupin superfamily)
MEKQKVVKVHEDNRGTIYSLSGITSDGKEITVLDTRRGFARGGCVHNVSQEYVTVLEGIVKYWIGDEHPEILRKGMSTVIPAKTPHMLVAQTDCIVMEWGKTKDELDGKDLEMRKKVEKINVERN